jgi:hypothetical protein
MHSELLISATRGHTWTWNECSRGFDPFLMSGHRFEFLRAARADGALKQILEQEHAHPQRRLSQAGVMRITRTGTYAVKAGIEKLWTIPKMADASN